MMGMSSFKFVNPQGGFGPVLHLFLCFVSFLWFKYFG